MITNYFARAFLLASSVVICFHIPIVTSFWCNESAISFAMVIWWIRPSDVIDLSVCLCRTKSS
jgi:hypothetical protein